MSDLLAILAVLGGSAPAQAQVPVDTGGYDSTCGVAVRVEGETVAVEWSLSDGVEAREAGRVTIDLRAGKPLIESIAVKAGDGAPESILEGVSPAVWVTVGSRVAPPGRPPGMSPFNVFFDKPANRPHETHLARLELKRARVASEGRRATVALGDLTAGPFEGELVFTFFAGSRLFRFEAAASTKEDLRAIIYDAGLAGEPTAWRRVAWMDTSGSLEVQAVGPEARPRRLAVRHRAAIAEGERGSVAVFPPPHQYQFPRDWTDNFKFAWVGRPHEKPELRAGGFGIGVCQDPAGGGAFVPWFNAPPGTRQRLGAFCLLSRGKAADALRETLRFTRGDRYPRLPGHLTLASHWHMAIAVASMSKDFQTRSPPPVPDLVRVFKDMGVDMVHLGEFHGDGHQFDSGPLRLPELEAMFRECRRLSDDELLLIPGEEVNTYLGIAEPGKHPGHWMSLFPKPVYWILKRGEGQPYVEEHPKHGKVYRVGSREDVLRILADEGGLAWAAHPRIKASSWTPDIFRHESFYLSESWLGAAWKAMPADLSRPRLGERALDLLDDMASWGAKAPPALPPGARRKYLLGEVDVFKIDRTHELYAHMNVNYLRLERLPRFDEGWQPVVDALRAGRFFVTTGEVLVRELSVEGAEAGEALKLPASGRAEVRAVLEWTFPMELAEIISGDGEEVRRERIPLTDTGPFGRRTIVRQLDLRGRRWVRLEAWDAAANGAFTQPVWIEEIEARPGG
ncbi:MAG: hypothetical protein HY721_20500 [Planctomycetes bacterium]|nr:hypothetical protein [Planctomycetota bacterium]